MALNDQVAVRKVYAEPSPSTVTNNGVLEYVSIADFLLLQGPSSGAGSPAAGAPAVVTRTAAPAAAPVPFADLTAAANSFNALRTALINAGVLV